MKYAAIALIILSSPGAMAQAPPPSWIETTSPGVPLGLSLFSSIWTGTELIIWGGHLGGASVNTGHRYNPSTDVWTAISTVNAPPSRSGHTAVWTGTEMIVWGGNTNSGLDTDTGARYDPSNDAWTAMTNAPLGRQSHSAVWTGTDMIVWGGSGPAAVPTHLGTGEKYNPAGDSWTPISTTGAPDPRNGHTAIWTGLTMVVWGGMVGDGMGGANPTTTGGRYFPGTDSWMDTTSTGAPNQQDHTAIWTGTEMIIWGGNNYLAGLATNAGARYDPVLDSWTSMSTVNAPERRVRHSAAWIAGGMIVWGGDDGFANHHTGGVYDPGLDEWTEYLVMGYFRSSLLQGAATDSKLHVWGLTQPPPPEGGGGGRCGLLGIEPLLILGILLTFKRSVSGRLPRRGR